MLTGGGAQAVKQEMGSVCKYRWRFARLPAAHLLLCGPVPNRPRTGTGPWPGSWGPLLQGTTTALLPFLLLPNPVITFNGHNDLLNKCVSDHVSPIFKPVKLPKSLWIKCKIFIISQRVLFTLTLMTSLISSHAFLLPHSIHFNHTGLLFSSLVYQALSHL